MDQAFFAYGTLGLVIITSVYWMYTRVIVPQFGSLDLGYTLRQVDSAINEQLDSAAEQLSAFFSRWAVSNVSEESDLQKDRDQDLIQDQKYIYIMSKIQIQRIRNRQIQKYQTAIDARKQRTADRTGNRTPSQPNSKQVDIKKYVPLDGDRRELTKRLIREGWSNQRIYSVWLGEAQRRKAEINDIREEVEAEDLVARSRMHEDTTIVVPPYQPPPQVITPEEDDITLQQLVLEVP